MTLIKLHRFHGGIHPNENKSQSADRPLRTLPIPQRLILPLRQHSGQGAQPQVSIGQKVLKGELIATAQGARSLPLHAPTSGVISNIGHYPVAHPSGLEELCIELMSDGEDRWGERQSLFAKLAVDEVQQLPPAAIVAQSEQMGIAGLGGAGFPTHLKLKGQGIETLIINGVECEPYITADDLLMRNRAQEVVQGARLLQHALGASKVLIAIEDNKPAAAQAMQQALTALALPMTLVVIPTLYPSGGERQLIKILTGNEVPSGRPPADLGIVCQNVGTAAALYRAVYFGEPLISRICTVTGDAIARPANYDALIGTPILALLADAGYQPQQPERVIFGGPLMGFALNDLHVGLSKTANCLLAPSLTELPLNNPALDCIRCGQCVEVCPQELLPQQLYWFAKSGEHDKSEQHNLFDCIECGACSYVCPSEIPLVQYYRHEKGLILQERAAQQKSDHARERFETRNARHARLEAEKEAQRQARAAAKAAREAELELELAATQTTPLSANDQASTSDQDSDALERKVLAQQDRVQKMQERLEMAKLENLDTLPLLEQGLAKQQEKLAALQQERAAQLKPEV